MAKARSFSLSLSLLPREFLEIFVCIWHRRKAHGFLPPLFFLINLIALDFPRTRFNVFLFFLSLFFSVFFLLLVNFPPALQNFRSIQRKRGFVSFFSLSLSLSQFLTNRWLIHEKISPTCFFFLYIYIPVSQFETRENASVFQRETNAQSGFCSRAGGLEIFQARQAMKIFAIIRFPNKRRLMKRLKDAYPRGRRLRVAFTTTTWLPLHTPLPRESPLLAKSLEIEVSSNFLTFKLGWKFLDSGNACWKENIQSAIFLLKIVRST